MICSSLNRLRLICPSPLDDGLHPFLEEFSGLRSTLQEELHGALAGILCRGPKTAKAGSVSGAGLAE